MAVSITWKHLVEDHRLKIRIYDGRCATKITIQGGLNKSAFRNGKFTKAEANYLKLNRIIDNNDAVLRDYKFECELRGYQPTNAEIKLRMRRGKQGGIIYYMERLAEDNSVAATTRKDISSKIGKMKKSGWDTIRVPVSASEAAAIKSRLQKEMKPATLRNYIQYFKRATEIAVNEGAAARNYFSAIKVKIDQRVPGVLTDKQIAALWKLEGVTPAQSNARWIILFQYHCFGIRISDALLLKWDKIAGGKVKIMQEKSEREIELPLSKEAKEILSKFSGGEYVFPFMNDMKARHPKKDEAYWAHGSRSAISKACAKIKQITGFRLTSHMARHTFAAKALDNGLPIQSISTMLGHGSIGSTLSYAKTFKRIIGKENIEAVYGNKK